MSVEIKNMIDVDVIETASGKENLLVESNGFLKRLPSSNFSGGGSGGSGAGYDIIGKIASVFTPNSGELITLDPITITPKGEPTFDDIFPVANGPYDQANIYTRILAGFGYNAYGYYSTEDSAWAYDIEVGGNFMKGEKLQTLGSFVTGPSIISSLTFAELQAVQNTRPITALIEVPGKGSEALPAYYQASINYNLYASEIVMAEDEDLEEIGIPVAVKTNGCIMLGLTFPGVYWKDDSIKQDLVFKGGPILVLFESGTEEEPVLGCAWLEEGF